MFNFEQLIRDRKEKGHTRHVENAFKLGHKTILFLQCKPGSASSVGFCGLCSSESTGNVLTIRVSKL